MKKIVGFGAYYCAKCGTRLLQGNEVCPECGQRADRPTRAGEALREAVSLRDVLESRAFRAYQRKNTLWKMIWAVGLALGVPFYLLASGQIDIEDEEGRVVAIVLLCMFLLIGIGSSVIARKGREWRRKAAQDGLCCLACGYKPGQHDAFCAKCGCAIPRAGEALPEVIIDAPQDAEISIGSEPPVEFTSGAICPARENRRRYPARENQRRQPARENQRRQPARTVGTSSRVNLLIGVIFIAIAAYMVLIIK